MQILALDLGKFKSVSCCFDIEQLTTEYWTLSTDRHHLNRHHLTKALHNYQPQLVVIEACGISAWVHDLCRELGFEILVCNPKSGGLAMEGRQAQARPRRLAQAGQTRCPWGNSRRFTSASPTWKRCSRASQWPECSIDEWWRGQLAQELAAYHTGRAWTLQIVD